MSNFIILFINLLMFYCIAFLFFSVKHFEIHPLYERWSINNVIIILLLLLLNSQWSLQFTVHEKKENILSILNVCVCVCILMNNIMTEHWVYKDIRGRLCVSQTGSKSVERLRAQRQIYQEIMSFEIKADKDGRSYR